VDNTPVDPQRMMGFVLSVCWRASISTHEMYAGMRTTYTERMHMRAGFEVQENRFNYGSLSISNLVDSRKRFKPNALCDFVVPPSLWVPKTPDKDRKALFFILNGFFFTLIIPNLLPSIVRKGSFWNHKSHAVTLPNFDVWNFPHFVEMGARTISKLP